MGLCLLRSGRQRRVRGRRRFRVTVGARRRLRRRAPAAAGLEPAPRRAAAEAAVPAGRRAAEAAAVQAPRRAAGGAGSAVGAGGGGGGGGAGSTTGGGGGRLHDVTAGGGAGGGAWAPATESASASGVGALLRRWRRSRAGVRRVARGRRVAVGCRASSSPWSSGPGGWLGSGVGVSDRVFVGDSASPVGRSGRGARTRSTAFPAAPRRAIPGRRRPLRASRLRTPGWPSRGRCWTACRRRARSWSSRWRPAGPSARSEEGSSRAGSCGSRSGWSQNAGGSRWRIRWFPPGQ